MQIMAATEQSVK